ncbi:TetR/AcrR family transcriptional regulator [Paenibacillus massiliensis]|uniref:TetR/AcrR family transcriptional regulator n=1 Tax=Paenibacillus massiliensis TaxID=225917 RepID=UPI00048F4489|nr:TetR/AcrR family transcriptional regulator [Paenibacillus massiliensis]
MKNEDRRKNTMAHLLTATKELLDVKGCHAITLKEIMERSGLSKGAIFHYVRSKDEIFIWILMEHQETLHSKFLSAVSEADVKTFEGPMQVITANLLQLEQQGSITNKILLYLLGKEDDPQISATLEQFYERSVSYSMQWIELGIQHGVIDQSVDTEQLGELFVLLSMGLRIRASMTKKEKSRLASAEISRFISYMLR